MTPPHLLYAEGSASQVRAEEEAFASDTKGFQSNPGIGQTFKIIINHAAGHKLKVKLGSSLHM